MSPRQLGNYVSGSRLAALVALVLFATAFFSGAESLSWTCATPAAAWPKRGVSPVVDFHNRLWLTGGSGTELLMGDEWSSEDGISWSLVSASPPWAPRSMHQMCTFAGKMWLLGGGSSQSLMRDVWNTSNGADWNLVTPQAPWSGREYFNVAVFDGKIWILAGEGDPPGYLNDVWSSSDGANWTEAVEHAAWTGRTCAGVAVLNGRLWLMGGRDRNDVWFTTDGASWTQAIEHAPWAGRRCHSVFAADGNLWVLGGVYTVGSGYNLQEVLPEDVWRSEDGVNWVPMGLHDCLRRCSQSCVVMNHKLWVMGGADFSPSGSYGLNDVWYAELPSYATVAVETARAWYTVGDRVALKAVAEKFDGALTYQWSKDNQPVAGQTGDTMTIESAELTDEGAYACTVTDEQPITRTSPPYQLRLLAPGSLTAAGPIALILSAAGCILLSLSLWKGERNRLRS